MPKRVHLKNKQPQVLLMLLVLAIALFVTFDTVVEICLASILASGGSVGEGEIIKTWSRAVRYGRHYYIKYGFEVDGSIYEGEHKVPRSVMEQAKEDEIVSVHYLAWNPAINAPQFWGESLVGYLIYKGWAVLVLVGFCAIFIMGLLDM